MAVKEGIKRETNSKENFNQLMSKLTEQEYQLKEKEEKCLAIASKHNIKFSGDIGEMTPTLKSQMKESKKIRSEKDIMDK